jgi:hypothetical protein
LQQGLKEATAGLENLKLTYREDTSVVSQLEVILMKVHGCVREIEFVLTEVNYERDEEPGILSMFPLE